jgi:site-specific recombinase XerD
MTSQNDGPASRALAEAAPPHAEKAVFEAMLSGWARQQSQSGLFQPSTIRFRQQIVRRFAAFAGAYPWQWSAADVDRWTTHLTTALRRAESTIRSYQAALRLFCDYVGAPEYGWPAECAARFDTCPEQVCHDWNTASHLVDYEGSPGRRPMTREEVQALLDHADAQFDLAMREGRKGALTAYRDATVFKVIYAWGLRCSEASALDLEDFCPHPEAPEFGRFGMLRVRSGRRVRGASQSHRMVVSVMPWAVEAVADYVTNIRPRYRFANRPALWPTERGGRLRAREIETRFAAYRDDLGFDRGMTPHCLRRAYMTHLIEGGTPLRFVQEQVGHGFAATTAIRTRLGTNP